MNNLSSSVKKFVGNKNTVTILGVVLCIVILYIGYDARIKQQVNPTKVAYANQTIQPRTKITNSMIDTMSVPESFLQGTYYKNAEDIIGKYSNYNTIIAKGSLFYTDLVVDEAYLPNSSLLNVEKDHTVISYKVDMDSTYANSMMPNDYIKIYFKARNDEGNVMFGKFLDKVKILDVKDSSGRHVFENSSESRTPAYMLFSLPEDMHLLFRKAIYLSNSYDVELILVPGTQKLEGDQEVTVSSKDIQDFINEKTEMVSVDEILSSTNDDVTVGDGVANSADAQDNRDDVSTN